MPTTGHDESSLTTVLHGAPEGDGERRFLLEKDMALELCSDGSYRSRSLLRGRPDSGHWTFFHSGRVRTVYPVGGIVGGVESQQSEGSVSAPMNGQVVKVVKAVGDSVEAGEIVLILEAMKMENEVSAPKSGVIAELVVVSGETVAPGQLLFSVEAAE